MSVENLLHSVESPLLIVVRAAGHASPLVRRHCAYGVRVLINGQASRITSNVTGHYRSPIQEPKGHPRGRTV